jgi:hypothetical protein
MKKIILIVPIMIIMLASIKASAQTSNQSNVNTPLFTGNQSNVNTPLLSNLTTSTSETSTTQTNTLAALITSVEMPLDEIFSTGENDKSLQSIISTIGTYNNETAITLKSLTPDTSGSSTQAVQAVSDAALGTVESHLESGNVWDFSTSS